MKYAATKTVTENRKPFLAIFCALLFFNILEWAMSPDFFYQLYWYGMVEY